MAKKKKISSGFGEASEALPQTHFAGYLQRRFDVETARDVFKTLQQLRLAAPEGWDEFMDGTEGALLFLNPEAVVVRIEHQDAKNSPSGRGSDRVNDSPWVMQPLASVPAGKAIIGIYPGCQHEDNEESSNYLIRQLTLQKIDFFDCGARNVGRLPVRTPLFPDGIPNVVDPGAVMRLTNNIHPVKAALEKEVEATRHAAEAKEKLYAPLRQAFENAWPDSKKMKHFWDMCRDYAQQGKLVAGWNEESARKNEGKKTRIAWEIAEKYEARAGLSGQAFDPVMPTNVQPSRYSK